MVHGLFNRIEFEKSLDYLVRNIIFVFQMKNSIPRYTFYKNKYGSELLVDVVELKYVKRFLAESAVHTLTYYDITFVTEGEGSFSIDNRTYQAVPGDVFFSKPGEVRNWDTSILQDGKNCIRIALAR